MKPLIFVLFSILCSGQGILGPILAGAPAPANCGAFAHCYTLTYDHTLTGTADTSGFPATVFFSNAALADVGNGGDVQNSSGSDILIYSDACVTQVPSLIEAYDNVMGIGWIKTKLDLSHTVSGSLTVCVGLASPPSRTTGVFDANYVGCWLFGTASGFLTDSCASLTLSNSTPLLWAAGTGQVDGGLQALGGGNGLSTSATTMGTTVTVECWENTATSANNEIFVEKSPINAQWVLLHTGIGAGNLIWRGNGGSDLTASFPSSGWHYIAATLTGTSGQIYLDSNAAVTGTMGAAGNTNTAINIGQYDGGGLPITGFEDEVLVSNVVRSSSYFTARFNNTNAPGNIGTPGFWTWGSRQ